MTKRETAPLPGISSHYRWSVFCRCCLAILGGYLFASLSVALITLLTPEELALATYSAMMLSFTVWLVAIMVVFSINSLKKASIVSSTSLLLMLVAVELLQYWRLS